MVKPMSSTTKGTLPEGCEMYIVIIRQHLHSLTSITNSGNDR